MNSINQLKELTVLRESKIVGITTSGCGNNHELIQRLKPKVIICEEAGEVIESHVLASLTESTEHLILIGDHQQLRPKINEFILSSECNEGFKLDISLFERLVQSEDKICNKLATLNVQRRMRPSISKLIKDTLYPNLENHENVCNYPDVQGFSKPLWFFDVNNSKEEKNELMDSFLNKVEAEYIIYLIKYLIHQGYTNANDLTILTPYLGQLLHIKKLLQQHKMEVFLSEGDETDIDNLDLFDLLVPKNKIETKKSDKVSVSCLTNQVRVSTIDNFQGEESKIVLISLVRSNNEGNIGFLKTPNRVNVMLSRAKHGMIIVGSSQTFLQKNKNSLLGKVIQSLKDDNLFGDYLPLICDPHKKETKVSSINELKMYSVDGGCDEHCNSRLPCGHTCPRKCHPDDLQHKFTQCLQPCAKKFKDCEHKCKKQCYEDCLCEVQITYKFPTCSHSTTIKCCEKNNIRKCRELIAVKLPYCNHIKNIDCFLIQENKGKSIEEMDKIFKTCRENCGFSPLNSGHECKTDCMECVHGNYPNKNTLPGPCKVITPHKLKCEHDCVGTCGHSQKECPPCVKQCRNLCVHSKCTRKCGEVCAICVSKCTWKCDCNKNNTIRCSSYCGFPCTKLPCSARCKKTMSCNHQCTSVCGEKCPDPKYACPKCISEDNKENSISVIEYDLTITSKDWNPDDDPIIQLPCKHVYTISSLDGYFELDKVYKQNTKTGEYVDYQLNHNIFKKSIPLCFKCMAPISKIARYGRVLNILNLLELGRKYLIQAHYIGNEFLEIANSRNEKYSSIPYTKIKGKLDYFLSIDPCENINSLDTFIEDNIFQVIKVQRNQAHVAINEYFLRAFIEIRELSEDFLEFAISTSFETCLLCKQDKLFASYEKNIKILQVILSSCPLI